MTPPPPRPPRATWASLTPDQLLAQCEVDTYRASGPGGQKRNKTSSAVRLRHPPTGLLVIAEECRSQHENKAKALNRLRQRLFLHLRDDLSPGPARPRRSRPCPTTPRRATRRPPQPGRAKDPRSGRRSASCSTCSRRRGARRRTRRRCSASRPGTSIDFLQTDPKVWQEANRLRAAAGQKPVAVGTGSRQRAVSCFCPRGRGSPAHHGPRRCPRPGSRGSTGPASPPWPGRTRPTTSRWLRRNGVERTRVAHRGAAAARVGERGRAPRGQRPGARHRGADRPAARPHPRHDPKAHRVGHGRRRPLRGRPRPHRHRPRRVPRGRRRGGRGRRSCRCANSGRGQSRRPIRSGPSRPTPGGGPAATRRSAVKRLVKPDVGQAVVDRPRVAGDQVRRRTELRLTVCRLWGGISIR